MATYRESLDYESLWVNNLFLHISETSVM